ncbi:MAG: PQQ-binding-like beta-propeller repeat protein [Verrucomicrobiota bacterium]
MPLLPRLGACLALASALSAAPATKPAPDTDWREYLGGADRAHYSPLAQIDRANVAQLKPAWEYRTGEPGEVQANPLIVGGVLYGLTAAGNVFALDGATGQERWRWTDTASATPARRIVRGLTYWESGDDRRILVSAGAFLVALDARTGTPIESFGQKGRASLKQGLGATAEKKHVISTTPGTLCGDLIVMPLRLSEGPDAAPGYVQAFDVRTGKLAWVFRTIPLPGEFGYETWPANAHRNSDVGGANCWAGMAYDAARHLLFVPTGSAAPDFWGGARAGSNLFANCLVALDARTGQRVWHFQFIHHDIWDRDLPSPPVLLTVRHAGRAVAAVAQTTKSGHVFLFDRANGKPLFPVEEKPAPKSTVPGEISWPTQPVPAKPAPFARQSLGDDDISPHAENRAELLKRFRAARRGQFEPFSAADETVILPGFDGGSEWGGVAADPQGILYVNANEMAWMARLKEVPGVDALAHLSPGQRTYVATCAGCHGTERQGNPAANLPPLLDVSTRKSREEVAQLTIAGKGMMPGFPALSASDRQALIDFLFGTEKTETVAPAAAAGATAVANAATAALRVPYRLDGYNRFIDSKGYPAITPPWGTLTAIDLNTGEHRWQVALGEYAELTAKGIAPTGTENYGGPIVTAGGVLFIAATKDAKLRAFDAATGKTLWSADLPAPGFATPATYAIGGRQYVVVAAGGTKLGTKKGESYVAYALP